uniref:Uncharacterized protein n=1 Tax=Moniliophthora roreri TaxID=221103 RepID=A0A0W0G5F5_MONRR
MDPHPPEDEVPLAHVRLMELYHRHSKSMSDVLKAAKHDRHRLCLQLAAIDAYDNVFWIHWSTLPQDVRNLIQSSIQDMRKQLLSAIKAPSTVSRFQVMADPNETHGGGRVGRPRKVVNESLLEHLTAFHRGSAFAVAQDLSLNPRLICWRQLEQGLVTPGQAPFQHVVNEDGEEESYHVVTRRAMTQISNAELDSVVQPILQTRKNYGQEMMRGALEALDIHITDDHIMTAMKNMRGPPPPFHLREIVRDRYETDGTNAMWHNDGNHKLI